MSEATEVHGFEFAFLSTRKKRLGSLCVQTGLEESIRHAVLTILSTAVGERPLDPSFGCTLHRFMYARICEPVLRDLAAEVRASLGRCEPRLSVTDVSVLREPTDMRALEIHIQYRIRSSGVAQSINFPLSLVD